MEQTIPGAGCLKRGKSRHRCSPRTIRMRTPEKENGFALRLAKAGDQVRIVALSGGKGCQDRLAGMGLRIGGEVQVLRNDKGKKLLLGYQGNRLFLGGGMAHKIKVAVIKGESK